MPTFKNILQTFKNLQKFRYKLLQTRIFLYLFTDWYVFRRLRPFCKLLKISKNLGINCCKPGFFVFLHGMAHLPTLEPFCHPWNSIFGNVWYHFAIFQQIAKILGCHCKSRFFVFLYELAHLRRFCESRKICKNLSIHFCKLGFSRISWRIGISDDVQDHVSNFENFEIFQFFFFQIFVAFEIPNFTDFKWFFISSRFS